MYKIFIDTTQRYEKTVRLVQSDKLIDEIKGDFDIVSGIRDILERHKLKPSDIKLYEANPGPGSFTGIKVGVTIANVLNWATGNRSLKNLIMPRYGSAPTITTRKKK